MKNQESTLVLQYANVLEKCLVKGGVNPQMAKNYADSRLLLLEEVNVAGIIFAMQIIIFLEKQGVAFDYFFDDEMILVAQSVSPKGLSYDKIMLFIGSESLSHEIRISRIDHPLIEYKLGLLEDEYCEAAHGITSYHELGGLQELSLKANNIAKNLFNAMIDIY